MAGIITPGSGAESVSITWRDVLALLADVAAHVDILEGDEPGFSARTKKVAQRRGHG